jgi:hypothetical protein
MKNVSARGVRRSAFGVRRLAAYERSAARIRSANSWEAHVLSQRLA